MIRSVASSRRSLMMLFSVAALGLPSAARAVPSFTSENGTRIAHASPESITGSFTSSLRLYFIRDFQVLSATSSDGLTWSEESGIRVSSNSSNPNNIAFSSVTSASVLPLSTTGYRMLLSVVDSTGNYHVVSASSSDGVNWGLEGIKFSLSSGTYAGSTRLAEAADGSWRLFYIRPFNTGLSSATFRVFTATSADEGVTWGGSTQLLTDEAHAVAPQVRTDGTLRLLYTAPLTGQTTATQVLSALETAGGASLAFGKENGVRFSTTVTNGGLGSLLIFRSSETFRSRLYEEFTSTGTGSVPNTMSALTLSPDPQSMSPPSVTRSATAGTFTVKGEVFSSSATVKLIKTGEADIIGTSASTSNDQTVTATLDTQNAALGLWDVVVTNSDGVSATLRNAVNIDFASGQVTILDNLFRPLKSQKAHIDVTLFNDGHLRIRMFTLEGRLVRTLFDGEAPLGTTTLDWDGTTDDGHLVASGVYLAVFEGPRLSDRSKIVVVK